MEEVLLSRKEILGAVDAEFKVIDVPKWKGKVRIRSLSGIDRARFENAIKPAVSETVTGKVPTWREMLVSIAIVDAAGELVFSPDDIKALGRKDAATLDLVVAEVMKLSGITATDAAEYEKNSETTLSGDGSSE